MRILLKLKDIQFPSVLAASIIVMCFIIYYFIILELSSNFAIILPLEENGSLQLIHVIFRHGDRTSEKTFKYPTDPNINETFYPFGRGELTKNGKRRMYNLGKKLRTKYIKLIGEKYYPDIIESWTSYKNRTQASLQLVLAGLFPPNNDELFDNNILWQPIPYLISNKLIIGISCRQYKNIFEQYMKSDKHKYRVEKFKNIIEYASKASGRNNIESIVDLLFLNLDLQSDDEFGLKLANWTEKIYPKCMEEIAIAVYREFTANTELRKYASGYLLEKIVQDSLNKISQGVKNKRKIYLYSGHELTLANFMETLEIFEGTNMPSYGSYIAIELHNFKGTFGFKIFYDDYTTPNPKIMKLPGCEEFCEINKFSKLVEEYFPKAITHHDKDCVE